MVFVKEINNIVITDSTGKAITASFTLTDEQKQVSLADKDYFQQVLTTGKPVFFTAEIVSSI